MDPFTIAALAGAGANLAGGLVTAGMSEGADDELRAAMEGREIVPLEQRIAQYEQLKQQGLLTPELEAEILAGDTALADIKSDPQYKDAQIEALTRMSRIGREGMLLSDQAELAKMREDTGAQLRGAQQAVMQNKAARGLAGSGDELAMQMANAQAAATQQAQADREIAAQTQSRKLNAVLQTGTMSGQMDEAEYAKAANLGSAKDRFKQFDVANRIGTQQRNVGSRNTAQQANLSEKQRIADTNVRLKNRQADQRVAAIQAIADEKYGKASGLGKMSQQAQLGRARAIGGAISSAGQAGAGLMAMNKPTAGAKPGLTADNWDDDNIA